jgi:hypothetical protein
MSVPTFIHVMSNGDVWHSNNINFLPSGTVLATFRVNSDAASQKLGTVSGNSGAYACSGHVGVWGKEAI